jgi:molybdate transport system substrate-binding protein
VSDRSLKAISSKATRGILTALADDVTNASLPSVDLTSVGGVDAARRVAEGEPFDLVILDQDKLEALADQGAVVPETVRPLVLSEVVVGIPGQSTPRLGNPATGSPSSMATGARRETVAAYANEAELRDAVLAARRIGYSTGPSGAAVLVVLDHLGIREQVEGHLVQARPGVPVAELLAAGEVDLGFQQLSEMAGHDGVTVLGPLPVGCAITSTFAVAVGGHSADPEGARTVIDRWTSAAVNTLKTDQFFLIPGDDHVH